jgi:hypothetical protein
MQCSPGGQTGKLYNMLALRRASALLASVQFVISTKSSIEGLECSDRHREEFLKLSEVTPSDHDFAMRDPRYNTINNWITENDPDIIFLQEAWNYRGTPCVALSIAKAMGYDVAYRIAEGAPGLLLTVRTRLEMERLS